MQKYTHCITLTVFKNVQNNVETVYNSSRKRLFYGIFDNFFGFFDKKSDFQKYTECFTDFTIILKVDFKNRVFALNFW